MGHTSTKMASIAMLKLSHCVLPLFLEQFVIYLCNTLFLRQAETLSSNPVVIVRTTSVMPSSWYLLPLVGPLFWALTLCQQKMIRLLGRRIWTLGTSLILNQLLQILLPSLTMFCTAFDMKTNVRHNTVQFDECLKGPIIAKAKHFLQSQRVESSASS